MRLRRGFTFIELLIVLSIASILALAGYHTYQRSRWWSQVRLGREEMYRALVEARSSAQRFNMRGTITITTPRTLRLELIDKSGTFRVKDYTLPPGVSLDKWNGGKWEDPTKTKITYTPPYGETNAVSLLFRVKLNLNDRYASCLRVFGVTGKVVRANVCP